MKREKKNIHPVYTGTRDALAGLGEGANDTTNLGKRERYPGLSVLVVLISAELSRGKISLRCHLTFSTMDEPTPR